MSAEHDQDKGKARTHVLFDVIEHLLRAKRGGVSCSSPLLFAPVLLGFPFYRRTGRILHLEPIGRPAAAVG